MYQHKKAVTTNLSQRLAILYKKERGIKVSHMTTKSILYQNRESIVFPHLAHVSVPFSEHSKLFQVQQKHVAGIGHIQAVDRVGRLVYRKIKQRILIK